MQAQKRDAGQNYIGLLSDEFEARRVAEARTAIDRPIKDHVIRWMAAMLRRRREAK